MTETTERSSVRECPECGEDGHQAWVLGHWYCPDCDLEYDDVGEPTELQAMAQERDEPPQRDTPR